MKSKKYAYMLSLFFVISFILSLPLVSVAENSVPLKKAHNPTSNYWSVRKVNGKIIAVNSMTKARKTVFTDVNKEDEISNYEISSLVGPILSVAESLYWEGGAHPGHLARLETINLDTGKTPVLLTDIFPEEEIVKALRNDKVVKKALGKKHPKKLSEIMEMADGGCEISFSHTNESFAFHHVKGGNVAVRIGLPHGCEAMRGNYTELGIYLPIPHNFTEYLKQAEKNHTLLKHLKNRPGEV